MSKVVFKLNREGVRQLLNSAEMVDILEEYGSQALARCDSGYNYSVSAGTGKTRAHANIKADDYEAYYHNLKTNTLIKAIK